MTGSSVKGLDRKSNQLQHDLMAKPSPGQGPNSILSYEGWEDNKALDENKFEARRDGFMRFKKEIVSIS